MALIERWRRREWAAPQALGPIAVARDQRHLQIVDKRIEKSLSVVLIADGVGTDVHER